MTWIELLIAFRTEYNMPQIALSKLAGLNCNTVWHWEKGGREPRMKTKCKVLRAMDKFHREQSKMAKR